MQKSDGGGGGGEGCGCWKLEADYRRLIKSAKRLLISLRSRVTDDRSSHLKDHQNEASFLFAEGPEKYTIPNSQ